jgi:hypothetical protein
MVRGDRAVGFFIRLVFPYATIPRSPRSPSLHIQESIRLRRSRGCALALDVEHMPRRASRRHDANLWTLLKTFLCPLERNERHPKGPPLLESHQNCLWQSARRQPHPYGRPRRSSCAHCRSTLAGARAIRASTASIKCPTQKDRCGEANRSLIGPIRAAHTAIQFPDSEQ